MFPGERVVVIGFGVTGLLHLQLTKACGARVIRITRSAWKRELAEQRGADTTLDSERATGTETGA